MRLSPGQELQANKPPKYVINKVLGQGRFGITYLAQEKIRDEHGNYHDGKSVAIKTLRDDLAISPNEQNRIEEKFHQEAVKLARFNHPHIVHFYDPFKDSNTGKWYIVMEYIDGGLLSERADTILSEKEALGYIQQIGSALIEVHRREIIHRDVRPENIMKRLRDGNVEAVLIDFGLALDFCQELTNTRPEEMADGYTPIELYTRRAKRGGFTDIYSLAVTLYNLLTGQVPPKSVDLRTSQASPTPPKKLNSQISDRVNEAILNGMEIEPEKRPQSIELWLKQLGLEQLKFSINRQPGIEGKWEQKTIRDWLVALGTFLAGIAAIATLFLTLFMILFKTSEPPTSPARQEAEELPTNTINPGKK